MRGDIHRYVPRHQQPPGHEQTGPRYAVVLQSPDLRLSTAVVAPTSTSAPASTLHPEIEIDGQTTRILVEQMRAVDTDRLRNYAGRLDPHEMDEVERVMRWVLDLR